MRSEADAIKSLQRFFAAFLPEPWDVRLTVEAGQEPRRPYALVEQAGSPITADGGPNRQDITIAYTVNLFLPRPTNKARRSADDVVLALREQVYRAVKWGPDLRRPTTDRIPLYSYEPRIAVQQIRVRGATFGTWRLGYDGQWTAPIARDPETATVQAEVDVILPDQALVVMRGRGVFDVQFVGDLAGIDVELLDLDVSALVGAPTAGVRVLAHGAAAPWRTRADYMRVESFGQTTIRDGDDPTLLQVAVDLRCTFARGRPLPFGQMFLQRISATSGNGSGG